jgi:hypothetical protein
LLNRVDPFHPSDPYSLAAAGLVSPARFAKIAGLLRVQVKAVEYGGKP